MNAKKLVLLSVLSLLLLAFLAPAVQAQTVRETGFGKANIDVSDLTEEQRAQLALQVSQMKQSKPVLEQTKEYVELGEAIGKAISGSAKEMGIAVNDFIRTDAGKITVFLICWHFFGDQAIHLVSGGGFFIIFISGWIYFFRKMCMIRSIEYHENGKKAKVNHWGQDDRYQDELRLWFWITLVLGVAGSVIIVFTG